MFEFMTLAVIAVGVIEEVIVPVGSYTVDQATWAAHQVAARVDVLVN